MISDNDLIPWYNLRDRLRSDFIRCMEEGRSFSRTRQRMLDRVEDVVIHLEQRKRTGTPGVPDSFTPDRPQPHRDALERRFANA